MVEGYTDVIALAQAGVTTAVATCGTALGEGHFRLLSRFSPRRVVLAFDSDEAGARAAERAHGMFEEYNLDVYVLVLPDGQDPADFITERGADEFEKLADHAEPLIDFMLQRSVRDVPLDSPEGKARALRQALPILTALRDHVLRSEYGGRLADLVGVSGTDVRMELERAARTDTSGDVGRPDRKQERGTPEVRSPARENEKEALKILAQFPDAALARIDGIGAEHFTTERFRKAWELLRASPGDPAAAASRTDERGIPELIAEVAVEPLRGEPTPRYVEQVLARLEEMTLKRQMDTLRKRLERLNPVNDAAEFDSLFGELTDLTSRYRAARARAGEGS